MILEETSGSDKILLVHNGALGDFFMAWPAILALRTALPDRAMFWAGKGSMYRWLKGLGISPAHPARQRGLRALYGSGNWPVDLEGVLIVWFGLDTPPPRSDERLLFLPGIAPDSPDTPPRDLYLDRLRRAGIARPPDWLHTFRSLFSSPESEPGRQILLFPGSGHPAKNWSMVKYLELAGRLRDAGKEIRFVLGPVEMERNMDCTPFPVSCPGSLEELERLVDSARLVIGNDSGPMHLAGCLGTPGLVLFGPTNPPQWGPPGLIPVYTDIPCRPCTATARITCRTPACMDIPVERVFTAARNMLDTPSNRSPSEKKEKPAFGEEVPEADFCKRRK
jgi:ADP-heptose:LPS heptosyltransferase